MNFKERIRRGLWRRWEFWRRNRNGKWISRD